MLFRLSSLLLSIPAFLAIAATLAAQQAAPVRSKVDVPVQFAGTYRFVDGTWSHAGSRSGSRVLYNCTTPGNYYVSVGSTWSGTYDHLFIDEGMVQDSNARAIDQINGFDFAYCTTRLSWQGNSAALQIIFYDDYLPCTTPAFAATCSYDITGLPLSSTNNLQCWGGAVDLEGGFECSTDLNGMFRTTEAGVADRSFGWAFGVVPGQSWLTGTGPILDLPCATPLLLNGCGSGNQNMFWWEDPSGAWTGCYWFGGVPWASFSMKMLAGGKNAFAYGHLNNTLNLASTAFVPGTSISFTAAGHSAGSLTAVVPPALTVAYVQAAETTGPALPSALVALSNGLWCLR